MQELDKVMQRDFTVGNPEQLGAWQTWLPCALPAHWPAQTTAAACSAAKQKTGEVSFLPNLQYTMVT